MRVIDGVYECSFPEVRNSKVKQSYQLLILLLLAGKVKIKKNSRGRVGVNNYDYHKLTPQLQKGSPYKNVKSLLNIINASQLNGFIQKTSASNRSFYRDIYLEFCTYFYSESIGSHTAGFVNLYRILERLSYSIPLIYFSNADGYYNTYDDLKLLFDEKKMQELAFLRKFIKQKNSLIDDAEKEVTYKYSFIKKSHYELLKKIVDNKEFESCDDTTWSIEIKFKNVMTTLVNVRNRYFHFSTGGYKTNISPVEIEDSDEFFSAINLTICSFLSFMIIQSIRNKYIN